MSILRLPRDCSMYRAAHVRALFAPRRNPCEPSLCGVFPRLCPVLRRRRATDLACHELAVFHAVWFSRHRSRARSPGEHLTLPPARLQGIRACVFDAYGTLFDFASAAARGRAERARDVTHRAVARQAAAIHLAPRAFRPPRRLLASHGGRPRFRAGNDRHRHTMPARAADGTLPYA